MTSVFCCCKGRTDSPPDKNHGRPAPPPPVVHVTPSKSSVPPSDAQALYELFETTTSGNDHDAGAATTSVGPRLSRLGALGHNIKKTLSETRLSRHSSRISLEKTATKAQPKPVPEELGLLAISNTSGTLGDLLASRNVSEGGYDSDAKAITTPELIPPSHAGTMEVSPESVANALRPLDDSAATCNTPARMLSDVEHLTGNSGTGHHSRTASAPSVPTTPLQSSLQSVLQLGTEDSPTIIVRRPNHGVANETVHISATPKPGSPSGPNVAEAGHDRQRSFSASECTSSSSGMNSDVKNVLKTLRERAEKVKQKSLGSTTEEHRSSLMSSLDPALLEYLRGSSDKDPSLAERFPTWQLVTATGSNKGSPAKAKKQGYRASGAVTEIAKTEEAPGGQQMHSPDSPIDHISDHESTHLFNMRISQRLASDGVKTTSPVSTLRLGSMNSYDPDEERLRCSFFPGDFSRPTSRGHIVSEHLRRPSDPETRRLFENGDVGAKRLHPKRKSVTSATCLNVKSNSARHQEPGMTGDGASSCYMSDAPFSASRTASLINIPRSSSTKTTNSLAIGGRQASLGQPQRDQNLSQFSSTQWLPFDKSKSLRRIEDSWTAGQPDELHHSRQVQSTVAAAESMTFEQNINGNARSSRAARRLRSGPTSTEKNEGMSEVSMGDVLKAADKRKSEVRSSRGLLSADERMSEISASSVQRMATERNQPSSIAAMGANEGLLVPPGRPRDGYGIIQDNAPAESRRPCGHPSEESASSLWERALKTAQWDKALSNAGQSTKSSFLAPDWTARGRPHRSSSAGNANESAPQEIPISPRHSRYRSSSELFSIDDHQRICAEARMPLPRVKQGARAKSVVSLVSGAPQPKKSLLDIRSTVPFKEFLSWTRFPSHTRQERTGSAGSKDGVLTRDFSSDPAKGPGMQSKSQLSLMAHSNQSTVDLGLHTPGSWRILAFRSKGKKNRSLTFPRAKKGQKTKTKMGMFWNWRQEYRNHSSDALRSRAGRPSSISKGVSELEYPELEIIPGYQILGSAFLTPSPRSSVERLAGGGGGEGVGGGGGGGGPAPTPVPCTPTPAPRRSTDVSRPEATGKTDQTVEGRDAEDWSKMYEECVDEMPSSIKSEVSGMGMVDLVGGDRARNGHGRGHDNGSYVTVGMSSDGELGEKRLASAELRDSTVNFRRALAEEEERLRKRLLEVVARGNGDGDGEVNGCSGEDEDEAEMVMPGMYVSDGSSLD